MSSSTLISSPSPAVNQDVRPSFETAAGFQILSQMAAVFCASHIVPTLYRANKANCMIACNMASRLGIDPVTVMQNLYIINGKPGWSSQFLIAMWNNSGRFSPVRYEWSPDRKACRATSMDLKTQEPVLGTTITMAMAKAEGWIDKPGSKWKTMPEQMLMYRAAAFMIRAYAAEIALGLLTIEEGEDITGAKALEYNAPAAPPTKEMADTMPASSLVVSDKTASADEVIDVDSSPKALEPIPELVEATIEKTVEAKAVEKVEASPAPAEKEKVAESSEKPADTAVDTTASASLSADAPVSDTTLAHLGELVKELNPPKDKWKASLMNKYKVEFARQLTEAQAQKVIVWAKGKVDEKRLTEWSTGATQKARATAASATEAAPFS